MNAFLSLGRWFFAIPFAIFGILNLMSAGQMADLIPTYLPSPLVWVFLGSAGLIAASVAMLLGRYDKLAATLLAVELLLFILLLDLPAVTEGRQFAMFSLMKDLSLCGGAMLYATYVAKDRPVVK